MNNKVLAEQIQNKYRNYELKPYAIQRGYKKQAPTLYVQLKRLINIICRKIKEGFKALAEELMKLNKSFKMYPYYYNRKHYTKKE